MSPILAVIIGACDWWSTELPPQAQLIVPPAVYSRWWTMTESCSGQMRDMASIRWYRVPGGFVKNGEQSLSGYYSPDGYIVVTDTMATYGAAVRHEMLHALLRAPGHPRAQFLGACRSLVDCRGTCTTDGGPWSAPAPWIPMSAESLLVTADLALLPRERDGERWLSLRVFATNPLSRAVVAIPIGNTGFGFDIRAASGEGFIWSIPVTDSSSLFFAASETKDFLFEFRVDPQYTLHTIPRGDYFLRGGFGQYFTSASSVTVTP